MSLFNLCLKQVNYFWIWIHKTLVVALAIGRDNYTNVWHSYCHQRPPLFRALSSSAKSFSKLESEVATLHFIGLAMDLKSMLASHERHRCIVKGRLVDIKLTDDCRSVSSNLVMFAARRLRVFVKHLFLWNTKSNKKPSCVVTVVGLVRWFMSSVRAARVQPPDARMCLNNIVSASWITTLDIHAYTMSLCSTSARQAT